jgi:hypothetical protein
LGAEGVQLSHGLASETIQFGEGKDDGLGKVGMELIQVVAGATEASELIAESW